MPNSYAIKCPSRIVLIGGGDVMLSTAQACLAKGFQTTVILAPRHAEEALLTGQNTFDAFESLGMTPIVVDDINVKHVLDEADWKGTGSLGLCFGSAWIFSPAVRAAFGLGLINYNPIPIPRYLGGAHYTWQILNGDRNGGCVLQLITDRLDRGPIIKSEYFQISDQARIPEDYFAAYNEVGKSLMGQFLTDLTKEREFALTTFDSLEQERLYLPRLHTCVNGFIDWSWQGADVERFCCAFDRPYSGAKSFIGDVKINFSDVQFRTTEAYHPYLAGLIVRSVGSNVSVAVRGGLLDVGKLWSDESVALPFALREGMRFATVPELLHRAMTFRPQLSGVKMS